MTTNSKERLSKPVQLDPAAYEILDGYKNKLRERGVIASMSDAVREMERIIQECRGNFPAPRAVNFGQHEPEPRLGRVSENPLPKK